MAGIFTSLISGALMSVQGVFNTEVTKQTSLWVSSAFVQFTAFLVCMAVWLITDRTSFGMLWRVEKKYMLLAGVLGALITVTVVVSMNTLGPAKAAMLIVISQIAVAWVIELTGVFGVQQEQFAWRRLAGMALAVVGIVLFKW